MRGSISLRAVLVLSVAVAVLGLAAGPAQAGTMSASVDAPIIDGADIANYGTVTGLDKWWAEMKAAGATKGQTFTTGSASVLLDAISYQVGANAEPTKTYVVRIGTVSGSTFSQIYSETFTQSFAWNFAEYMTWTLDSAVVLQPNTVYGIDVGMTGSSSGWESGIPYLNVTGNDYTGGVRFTSGPDGAPGIGNSSLALDGSTDRIFHLNLANAAAYWNVDGEGAWDAATTNWNSAPDGTGTASAWPQGLTAVFAAGANGMGSYTVTVADTQDISGMGFTQGAVTLTGGALRMTSNSTMTVAGGLTATVETPLTDDGAGLRLLKDGIGTLILSGANSYSGGTDIQAGTLRLGASNVIPDSSAVKVAAIAAGQTATLDANGNSDTIGSLTLGGATATSGAAVTTGAGTLTLGGDVTYDSSANPLGATISGNVDLGAPTRTFTVGDSATAADDLTVSANISGSGAELIKAGTGKLLLSGSNSYDGATTVTGGTIQFNSTAALGSTSGINPSAGTTVAAGFDAGQSFLGLMAGNANAFTVALGANGTQDLDFSDTTGANLPSASLGATADVTYTGTLTPAGGTYRLGGGGGTLTLPNANALTDGNSLVVNGNVTLSAANDYSGPTTVNAGTLTVNDSLASQAINVNGGGLNLNAPWTGSTLTVTGGTTTLGAAGTTVASADFSAGTGTVDATNALTVNNTMTLPGGTTVTTDGPAMQVSGSNIASTASGRTITVSGGTVTMVGPAAPAVTGISYHQITNDADSGISSADTFTHAVDFGSSGTATVNGVVFANDVNVAAGGRANSGGRTYGANVHGGDTPPAVGGEVAKVFHDMQYGGTSGQYIELTGLTEGQWYDVRLYDRAWDYNSTTRTYRINYNVGSDGSVEYQTPIIDQNRADLDPPDLSGNVSWATSYVYQADSSGKIKLIFDILNTANYHLYGLTNQLLTVVGAGNVNLPTTNIAATTSTTLDLINPTANHVLGSLTLSAGTTVSVANAAGISFAGVNGPAGTTLDLGAAVALTLNVPTGQSAEFAGTLSHDSAAVSLTKTGAGTQTLSSSTTYTGATTISAGTLTVNGSLASLAITVNGGGLNLNTPWTGTTLTVTGGATTLGVTGATVASANFSAGTGSVNAANALTVTNTMTLPGGLTATLTDGTSFTAAGANLADDNVARTLSLSGGTLTFSNLPPVPVSVTLTNPSFETDAGVANAYNYQAITGWTGGTGIEQGTSRTFAPAAPPNYNPSTNYKWAFIQNAQTMSQTVDVTAAGDYTVSFAAVGRGGTNGPLDLAVQIDSSVVVAQFIPSQTAWNTYTSAPLALSAGSHTLNFVFINRAGGDKSSDLDAVTMTGMVSGGVTLPYTSIAATASTTLDLGGSTYNHVLGGLTLSGSGTALTVTNAAGVSFGGINGAAGTTLDATSSMVVTTSVATGQSASFAGVIANGAGEGMVSSLVKTGAGTQTLSGNNSYSGTTRVSGGTLNLTGSIDASDVTVASGGKLAGGGSAKSVAIDAGGGFTWSYGDGGDHTLNVNGALSLAADWVVKLVDLGDDPLISGKYNLFTYTGASTLGSYVVDSDGIVDWDLNNLSVVDDGNGHVYITGIGVEGTPGDTNGDKIVDAADFITLKKNFGAGEDGGVAVGNFDNTGTVDWTDLSTLMNNMTPSDSAPSTTPEPATLFVMMAAGLPALLKRRRRVRS